MMEPPTPGWAWRSGIRSKAMRDREDGPDDPGESSPTAPAGRWPIPDLRRGDRRLRRRRRHGRPRPHDPRLARPHARGRKEAAYRAGAPLDAVAVRSPPPG